MMTYKEIYYLTGQCMSLDERPEARALIVQQIKSGRFDWQDCLQLWSDHLVIPAIYLRFRTHKLLHFLPQEVLETMTGFYEQNCQRNAAILGQVKRVSALLLREPIFPVFLKGAAQLLTGLYSDPGERMIHDIDLLVAGDDFQLAVAMLEEAGYKHDGPRATDLAALKHYPPLYKADEPVVVEIHRMPVPAAYGQEFTARVVFRNKQPVVGLPGVYVPCNRHQLIHTFIHSQLADRGHVYHQSSFRSFNDLLQLSKHMQVFTLPTYTNYRRKAICWLVWGQRAMGLPGRFYPFETRAGRWYALKYELVLGHATWFQVYLFLHKLLFLLFVRIGGGLLLSFYRKDQREAVLRKFKSPANFGAQLKTWIQYF